MSTAKSRFVDELIASAKSQGAQADSRRALRADDGIDYRRRVLARLIDRPTREAHPASAQLWKQANERLDQLGL